MYVTVLFPTAAKAGVNVPVELTYAPPDQVPPEIEDVKPIAALFSHKVPTALIVGVGELNT